MSGANVLLGGYPAKECARRVHNTFDPSNPVPLPSSVAFQQRLADGVAFESTIVVALAARLGAAATSIHYGDHHSDKPRRVAETLQAMESGAPVIIGGQLPDDGAGSRTGSPDVLFRVSPPSAQRARYVPADIKHHSTLKAAKTLSVTVSAFDAGFDRQEVPGFTTSTSYRTGDCLQLAHYTRMLEAIDRHPGEGQYIGAILGTSDMTDIVGDRYGFVWYDLSVPTEKTWSSQAPGHTRRSIMDCYDYEFALRVRIAQAARDGGEPLVQPFGKGECAECPYRQHCAEVAGVGDASFTISTGFLSDREWRYLHSQGLGSVEALAEARPEGSLLEGFEQAAAHLPTPEKRLTQVIDRARMHRDGVLFERTSPGVMVVPSADVEIDFDVEWHPGDDHVYQWGARVRYDSDENTATYEHSVLSFDPLDEAKAAALAAEFFTWMEQFVAEREAEGLSVRIYHWTTPETSRATKMLGGERAARLFEDRFLDLKAFMARHYFARDGFSLKVVAPAFGFSWRAGDAGGAMSIHKIDEARSTTDAGVAQAAREWLLTYNEDDCAAQAAIRDGLRLYPTAPEITAPETTVEAP